jgi:putative transposase
MQRSAAARTMAQARRILKGMDVPGMDWGEVAEGGRAAIRRVLEDRMQERVGTRIHALAAGGYADRRNGSYQRELLTSLGVIELAVPRTRTYGAGAVLRAYRLILACFVLGLSTRKVGEALLTILGERVSAATVSRVVRTLDEAVSAFHGRPLRGRYRALVLDGVVLSRKTGAGAVRRPVLVALGITAQGRKEILDFRLATSESAADWERFLTDLYHRGLEGDGLEIVITDGGAGLLAALPVVLPKIPVQRCWAHKTRNILDRVRQRDRDAAKRDLHRISHAADRTEARRAARRFADRWEHYPAAVQCLRKDLDELLAFLRFSDQPWRTATRTTNAIERRFREVRRRTRPMGVFGDRTSMERILFAVFSYENQKAGTSTPFLLTQTT